MCLGSSPKEVQVSERLIQLKCSGNLNWIMQLDKVSVLFPQSHFFFIRDCLRLCLRCFHCSLCTALWKISQSQLTRFNSPKTCRFLLSQWWVWFDKWASWYRCHLVWCLERWSWSLCSVRQGRPFLFQPQEVQSKKFLLESQLLQRPYQGFQAPLSCCPSRLQHLIFLRHQLNSLS